MWWNTIFGFWCIIILSLRMRTVLHGPLKFKTVFVAKLLRDLLPNVPNLCIKFKTFFHSKLCIKCANDLTTISNGLVLLSTCFWNLKSFLVNRNCSQTRLPHNRDINNKRLTNPIFSVNTVSYGSSFFSANKSCMPVQLCAYVINRRGRTWSVTYSMDLKLGK